MRKSLIEDTISPSFWLFIFSSILFLAITLIFQRIQSEFFHVLPFDVRANPGLKINENVLSPNVQFAQRVIELMESFNQVHMSPNPTN